MANINEIPRFSDTFSFSFCVNRFAITSYAFEAPEFSYAIDSMFESEFYSKYDGDKVYDIDLINNYVFRKNRIQNVYININNDVYGKEYTKPLASAVVNSTS